MDIAKQIVFFILGAWLLAGNRNFADIVFLQTKKAFKERNVKKGIGYLVKLILTMASLIYGFYFCIVVPVFQD